jgi:alpha-L-fucosidase
MGQWLAKHGESIYGTRKGAFLSGRTQPEWTANAGQFNASGEAVSTRRGDMHYIHLLHYTSDEVEVKDIAGGVDTLALKATLLDGTPVKMTASAGVVKLTVPAEQRDPLVTVVKLQ